jgi:hypothetical protein
VWRLQVNGVDAADHDVVDVGHFRGDMIEHVWLFSGLGGVSICWRGL